MPRNGSGTYTPPSSSWYPAVEGQNAETDDWNSLAADLSDAISDSISADGQTPITANLPMSGFKFTGLGPGSSAGDSLRYEQLVGVYIKTVSQQVFTSSGTYTPTTGMVYAIVECVGAGAGGGGVAASSGGGQSAAGGGGGGGYSRKRVSASDVGASKTVTIGAAGAGGTAGNNNGVAGGDTSVGSLCIGKGGSAGGGGANGAGGAGGVAGTGDLTVVGQAGGTGNGATILTINLSSGHGGAAALGFGPSAPPRVGAGAGVAASNYGAGGSGAVDQNAGGAKAGGNGANGLVVITEFCA